RAWFPSAQLDTFSASKSLYRKVDTIVEGLVYTDVYVISTTDTGALYSLNFSYVGEGQGHYQLSSQAVNGKAYEWVAPVNGVPQGAYEPVEKLIAPKMHQMMVLNGQWEL